MKWKKRYWVYTTILFCLLTIMLIPNGRERFRDWVWGFIPAPSPHEINVSAIPRERGIAIGKKFKWEIKLLDKVYIRHFAPPNLYQSYLDKATNLFALIPKRWQEEVEGLASSSGVDVATLKLGNTFLDMGLNASGCRQIHADTPNGFFHAHNLDWDNLGGVGNYLVTIIRSDNESGRLRTLHITFPGMIGSLDIINEKGVAMSFNQIGISRSESLYPVFIAMRDIAESCGNFDSARKRILEMPKGMPFCIGLSSATEHKSSIFERDNELEPVFERPSLDGISCADNVARKNRPDSELDKLVRAQKINNHHDLIGLLRNPKILLSCNIYSVIFDYNNNVFYLASGTVPAALAEYRIFMLFPKDK